MFDVPYETVTLPSRSSCNCLIRQTHGYTFSSHMSLIVSVLHILHLHIQPVRVRSRIIFSHLFSLETKSLTLTPTPNIQYRTLISPLVLRVTQTLQVTLLIYLRSPWPMSTAIPQAAASLSTTNIHPNLSPYPDPSRPCPGHHDLQDQHGHHILDASVWLDEQGERTGSHRQAFKPAKAAGV